MRANPLARAGRGVWIGAVALYFFLPLLALAVYSFWAGGNRYDLSAYTQILKDPNFRQTFTAARL